MATNKKSRLAEIYRSEQKKGGGIASTLGKAAIEKIDPRQMFNQKGFLAAILPALFKAYKAAPSGAGKKITKLSTPTITGDFGVLSKQVQSLTAQMHEVAVNSTIIAKNTMVLPAMARDTNIIRQNISKLVKLQGGSASKNADMFFKTSKEREAAYESKFKKENKGVAGAPAAPGGKASSSQNQKYSGLASVLKVLSDSMAKGLGIAALGVGIGGFFTGLAAGGAAVTALGGASGVKDMMVNLAEGLNAFNTQSMIGFGVLLGTGGLFGMYAEAGSFLKVPIGMGVIGLGLGAFFSGLSVGGFFSDVGDPVKIKDMMVNLAEGLNAFNTQSMIALGALIAAGMFSPVKTGVGIVAVGAAISLFLMELALANKVIGVFSDKDAGNKIRELLTGISSGVKSFENLDETKLAAVAEVLPKLGSGIFSVFGGSGIGGALASIGEKIRNWIGLDKKLSPIEQLSVDLQKLNGIDYSNLSNLGKGFRDLIDGFNYYSQANPTGPAAPRTTPPGTTPPGTTPPGTSAPALPVPSAPTTPLGTNRMFGSQIPSGPVAPSNAPSNAPAPLSGNITAEMEKRLGVKLNSQGRTNDPRAIPVPPITPTASTGVSGSNLSSPSPLKDYGTYTPKMQAMGKLKNVVGSVFHHTAGDSVSGALSTLKTRGLSYHYLVNKDGTITQLLPEGAVGQHTSPGDKNAGVKGISNNNTIGIGLVASDDNAVTPEQINAAIALNAELSRKFGYPETSVWGHGEVSKGKMPNEGQRAVMAIRSKPNLDQSNPSSGNAIASVSSDLSNGQRGMSAPNITVVASSDQNKQSAPSPTALASPIDRELNGRERLLSRQTSLMA